jgi:hypothetical protein
MLCGGIGCAWADIETMLAAAVSANAAAARFKVTRLKDSANRAAIRLFRFSVNAYSQWSAALLSCFAPRRLSFFREKEQQLVGL